MNGALWSLPLLLCTWVACGAGSTVESRVASLLASALAETSAEAGVGKVDEAFRLLAAEGHKLPATSRSFLAADVRQTRGRVLAASSTRDKAPAAAREARRHLQLALDQYEKLHRIYDALAASIEAQLGDKDPTTHPGWRAAIGNVSRANYALAWTEYTLGTVAAGAEREKALRKALERFVAFTADGYRSHPIVADCFLGHALCLHELERHFLIPGLLEDVTPENTSPRLWRRFTVLLVRAYKAQGAYLKLETAADQYFRGLAGDHKYDSVDLELAVERVESLGLLSREMPQYRDSFRKRLDAMSKLLYSHGPEWRSRLAAAAGKGEAAGAFAHLAKAREHFSARSFQEAHAEAARGLKSAGARSDPAVLADLRYTRAAAAWNLKRWPDAWRGAVGFVTGHPKDDRAAAMCDRAIQAALRCEPAVPMAELARFLDFAEEHFPDVAEVRRAPWYRAKRLIDAGEYEAAQGALRGVAAGSPVYRQALYGLALAVYKRAETAEAPSASRLLQQTAEAVARFAAAAPEKPDADEERYARAMGEIGVATAERLLRLAPPDHAAAAALVQSVGSLLAADESARRRCAALRVEIRVAAGDMDGAMKLLDALFEQQVDAEQMAGVFTAIAEPLEAQHDRLAEAGQEEEARQVAARLAGIYAILLRRLSGKEAAAEQQVAVRRRLARSLQRAGRHADSLPHYKWLSANVPKEQAADVLRGMGLACESAGKLAEAIPAWRTLSRGLEKRSAAWCEAWHHLLLCYHKTGRGAHARKLFDYFRLQHPEVRSAAWQEKFDALDKVLPPAPARAGGVVQRGDE